MTFWCSSLIFQFILFKCYYSTEFMNLGGKWTLSSQSGHIANLTATVPGGIYSDLMNNHIIGDVFFEYNDTDTIWVAQTNWNYYRNFNVDEKFFNYKSINLIFEGLDTFADIILNNAIIGHSKNMFIRYIFNIKNFIKLGDNLLQVRFKSPIKKALEISQQQDENYTIPLNCPPSDYHGQCHVNQIRKMQASFSWDWGPALPSMGIWKPVMVEGFDYSTIRYVNAETILDFDFWLLKISTYLSGKHRDGVIIYKLHLEDVIILKLRQVPYDYDNVFIEVPRNGVKMWWPNGYGDQPLYQLSVQYTNNNETSMKMIKIGFRTVELVQKPIKDKGASFYFKINNQAIFAKGANQIPFNILPEKGQDQSFVYRIMKDIKDTNMNMLRVWGGGVYESDYFYDLADQNGILIWQDFMFACSMYPTREEYLKNVIDEVQHQVQRLNWHSSIVLWAGNNENEAALMQNWYNTSKNFTRYEKDYCTLYIDTIKKEFKKYSNKIFVSSSPSNGGTTCQLSKNPQDTQFGDVHFYNYIFDSLDPAIYPVARFVSEYGYQSLPDLDAWHTATNNANNLNLDSLSNFMKHRQHHPMGYTEILHLIEMQFTIDNIKKDKKTEALIYYSQILQALSVKIETELYRSYMGRLNSKGEGNTMGALFWQLNDVWVAPTWSSIDFTGKWKMLQYYAKDFFSSIIICGFINIERELNIFIIPEISQLHKEIPKIITEIEIYSWNYFKPITKISFNQTKLVYGSSNFVTTLKVDDYLNELDCGSLQYAKINCFFRLIAKDISGNKIAPENFVFPSKLKYSYIPKSSLKIKSVKNTDRRMVFLIEIESDKIALFVWLDSHSIDGIFSENGFIQFVPKKIVYFYSKIETTIEELKAILTITHFKDSKYF